jgi:ABC-2 type transport system ATP-binding protein
MTAPAIELTGLTRDFGKRRAVDGLTLRVEPGEIFGFLGPNGAGKTTTIRCLLGLARPNSGDAKIFGRSVVTDRVAALEGVGALVEGPALYSHLSAIDHLSAAAYLVPGSGNGELGGLLEQVGLGDRAGDRVSTFSRGMKQRLAIATALLGSPRLLVLDEPTDGLDPLGTVEIRRLLGSLRDRGVTVFTSSHLLAEVEATCDRVAVLDRGRLKAVTTVASIAGDRSLEDYFLSIVETRAGR